MSTAIHRCARIRFDTEYVVCTQDAEGVTATARDRLTGAAYVIRAKYLLGADGANSRVVADLGLPMDGQMGVSGSINIVFDADLSRHVAHRPSVLYWIIQPGSDVGGLGLGVVRMVRPWHRWLAIWGYDVSAGPPTLTDDHAEAIVRRMIGDPDVPIHIDSTSTWTVNDMYAVELSRGRVFCLDDAVHRHPPTNGLGSNASIGDAYNLAWKLALVLRGAAAPSLLETYSAERAPVARQVVKRANKSLGCFPHYTDPHRLSPEIEKELDLTNHPDAESLVKGVDIVNLQMPLYPSTEHFFNDAMFAKMKRGAYLVNTARGKLVERDAVVRALDPGISPATRAMCGSRSARRLITPVEPCPGTA